MNKMLLKLSPLLLILLGLFCLFILSKGQIAGVFILIGIVMLVERIWPEEWGSEENAKKNK